MMKDIDRAISKALAAEAESFVPIDLGAAEQRFVRRRRRRRFTWFGGATLATAAAVIAVAVFPRPDLADDRQLRPPPAGLLLDQRFSVPEEPLSIAAAPSGIWVASRAGGAITRIDPRTGTSDAVSLEGAGEVAVGDAYAWAGGSEGRTVRIDAGSMTVDAGLASSTGQPMVDMAVGGHELGAAWALDASGCLIDMTNPQPDNACVNPPALKATDVATSPNETWLLDGGSGILEQFHAGPGVNEGRSVVDGASAIPSTPAGPYADLIITTAGNDALWVSGEGGQLMRLDLVTGETSSLDLPGDYVDLAAGYGSVWALVGHEGRSRGDLVEIDVDTGEEIGTALALTDKPSDLVATIDSVWVTLRESNEVLRIVRSDAQPSPAETSEASPTPEASGSVKPVGPDELVMVFSGSGRTSGRLYAMYGDGRTELLTSPVQADFYPSFVASLYSDNPAVIVERRDLKTLDSELKYLDIVTREETELVPGSLPAVSPTGQIALWRMEKENPTLFITEIGTDFQERIPLDGLPSSIGWDAMGRFIYVDQSAGHEDWRMIAYDFDGETGPFELDPGANARYLAPSSRERDSLHLIKVEWAEGTVPAVDSIALVEVPWATFDPGRSTEVVSLDGLGLDENAFLPENLRLTATGTLDAIVAEDGTISWGIGDERSWILGFRTEAWLVKESGEIVDLGDIANGGIAIAPELLDR